MKGIVLVIFACLLAAAQPASARETELRGVGYAVDGDTLDVAGQRIRLATIDAVESSQMCTRNDGAEWPCGQAAKAFLANLLAAGEVRCIPTGKKTYNRFVAFCRVNEKDLGAAIAENGFGVNDNTYGKQYLIHQLAANRAKRGIWSGEFQLPKDFRAAKRR